MMMSTGLSYPHHHFDFCCCFVFIQSSKMKLNAHHHHADKRKLEIEAIEDGKSLKSSTKFFERLQEKNELQKIQKKAKPIIIQQANLAKKLKL